MYHELYKFCNNKALWKSLLKDGELYTSIIIAIISYIVFLHYPDYMQGIKSHLTVILTVVSIIFGFALSALLFYIQSVRSLPHERVLSKIASKIIDWHIWTLLCLLSLVFVVCILWAIDSTTTTNILDNTRLNIALIIRVIYSFFIFQLFYCGFQILNHVLTIWWYFNIRDKVKNQDHDNG